MGDRDVKLQPYSTCQPEHSAASSKVVQSTSHPLSTLALCSQNARALHEQYVAHHTIAIPSPHANYSLHNSPTATWRRFDSNGAILSPPFLQTCLQPSSCLETSSRLNLSPQPSSDSAHGETQNDSLYLFPAHL